jgi:hypothetical protein
MNSTMGSTGTGMGSTGPPSFHNFGIHNHVQMVFPHLVGRLPTLSQVAVGILIHSQLQFECHRQKSEWNQHTITAHTRKSQTTHTCRSHRSSQALTFLVCQLTILKLTMLFQFSCPPAGALVWMRLLQRCYHH